MLPSYYQYYCPVKILSGKNALDGIPREMDLLGCKKAMIVTDKGVAGAGLIDIVKAAFKGSQKAIGLIFDEVPPDSSNRIGNKVARLFEETHCDCFIAVGGGSSMDTAKGANINLCEDSDDMLKLQGVENITNDLLPMIFVPTTAGTGSEVTKMAVIYNEEIDAKFAFYSDKLYPRIAVVDPRMTATLPPKFTAATGMDALTHAIEAYTCLQKNPMADAYARAAIRLISKYIVRATKDGHDEEARLNMANAAVFAGIAFSNANVGMVHAIAHASGGVCHVPHGIANSILLPWVLDYNRGMKGIDQRIAEISGMLGDTGAWMGPYDQAGVTVSLVRNLLERLNQLSGMPVRFKDAGVTADKLPVIAKAAINDGAQAYNPRAVTYDVALDILKKAF
ncbi:MAG: iron-containing alcohol dehydrogenase [Thermodesulfobacteriota bacterium]|nr:iron-containing alcohol dehydrogenase [Thermodesulfobacteriota bacterium]